MSVLTSQHFLVRRFLTCCMVVLLPSCPTSERAESSAPTWPEEWVDTTHLRADTGCIVLAIGDWLPRAPDEGVLGRSTVIFAGLTDSAVVPGRFWHASSTGLDVSDGRFAARAASDLRIWLPGPDSIVVGAATLGRRLRVSLPRLTGVVRGRVVWGTDDVDPLSDRRASVFSRHIPCGDATALAEAAGAVGALAAADTGNIGEWRGEVMSELRRAGLMVK